MLHGAGKEVDMYNFTLYMTTACNFECKYCYEDYKEQNHLNEESLVQTLEFIMNYGDKGKILLDFLGGEPLLKKDLIVIIAIKYLLKMIDRFLYMKLF